MTRFKCGVLAAAFALVGACDASEEGAREQSRMLPVSFEALDGTVAIGGWYDLDDATMILDDEVLVLAGGSGEPITVDLGDDAWVLAEGQTEVALPYALDVGDTVRLGEGAAALELIVEDADFEGDPDPVEQVRAGGSESCGLSFIQGAYVASWGCATLPVSGTSPDGIFWNIEDFKTDGFCVQLWMQSNTTGQWSRLDTSCGPTATGSVPRSNVWKLRLFRTNTGTSARPNPPPGRYMTIYTR